MKEKKSELIEAIQEISTRWDALAQSDAIEAVRNPDKKEYMARARISVARADACEDMKNKVIDLIHSKWPKEE